MSMLEFKNVSKKLHGITIAEQMDLQIREDTFSVIFGAPGSGKSTLLRLITGLEKPDSGDIYIAGKRVNNVKPGDRNIGYVPQSFALYPHYSVFDNIAYPLKLLGVSKKNYTPIVQSTAEQLQITHLLEKRPDQCSGGEKQRVAIARGIVKNTQIFILDDPLTGLDFKLRERLFDDLREMREGLQATFIYTTSDPLEALMLAEDIHVFDNGKIIEHGDIEDVYYHPQHVRSIAMLGFPNTNTFTATIKANGSSPTIETAFGQFQAQLDKNADSDVYVALRPQYIRFNPMDKNDLLTFEADVTLIEDLGGELHVYLEVAGMEMEAVVPHHEAEHLSEGSATIGVLPQHFQIFSTSDHTRIGQGA